MPNPTPLNTWLRMCVCVYALVCMLPVYPCTCAPVHMKDCVPVCLYVSQPFSARCTVRLCAFPSLGFCFHFKQMNPSAVARRVVATCACVLLSLCVCLNPSVCAYACFPPVVYACVRYEQSVSFPAAQATNHIPPSSLFITYSWVSVSAGLWLALNEQLTALSVSQCYGNKISQSVQKQHQSNTSTGTLFNSSSDTARPLGRLTYWMLSTAWHLWYDSHKDSNLLHDQVHTSWNAKCSG